MCLDSGLIHSNRDVIIVNVQLCTTHNTNLLSV